LKEYGNLYSFDIYERRTDMLYEKKVGPKKPMRSQHNGYESLGKISSTFKMKKNNLQALLLVLRVFLCTTAKISRNRIP